MKPSTPKRSSRTSTWEKEFFDFFIYITDPKNYINGKPVWKGWAYVSVGNAIKEFVREQKEKSVRETIDSIDEAFNIAYDGPYNLSQTEWEQVRKKLLSSLNPERE